MNPFWDSRPQARHARRVVGTGVLCTAQIMFMMASGVHALPMFPVSEPLETERASSPHVTPEQPDAASALRITAERTEFDQVTEEFKAVGSVVVTQGTVRLTADRAVLHKLSGRLTATGHVHLEDQVNDVWAEELTINVNTESVLVVNGKIFLKETGTWFRGRLLQRFSETHYRVKDGTFTNCEADDGQIPDWSFSFQDVDVEQGGNVFAKDTWLNIRNQPVLPVPVLRYPMPNARKTGFLVPTIGFDNVLGVQYRQGFYWALSPSQDLTIAPQILTKRGQGGDVKYRYVLNRRSRGQWLINAFNDTKADQTRAQVTGGHVHHVQDDFLIQAKINYATDRRLLRDLSASGISRALPSQESVLHVMRRLPGGAAYLRAQYLQPLDAGGRNTFQRLPEIGHRFGHRLTLGAETVSLDIGLDSTFVHFAREQGSNVSRFDFMPALAVHGLHLGHVIGLRPQFKIAGPHADRARKISGGDHLAGDEMLENQRVQPFCVTVHILQLLGGPVDIGRPDRLVSLLRPCLGAIEIGRLRKIFAAETLLDMAARGGDRIVAEMGRIGSHVGYMARLIQALGRGHGLADAESEPGARGLLQGRGDERRPRP